MNDPLGQRVIDLISNDEQSLLLCTDENQVAIFDATNSTEERRRFLVITGIVLSVF